jgi:uncharacterized damage-inducible protein DinB
MKIKLLFFLITISINGMSQVNQALLNAHSQKLNNAKVYLLTIINSMDENKFDYKPVKEEMSFKEQLLHIGENLLWLSSTYIKEQPIAQQELKNHPAVMSKKEISIFVGDAFDYAIKTINDLDQSTLLKEFSWSGGKMNKLQFLNLIQDHQSHHVGQLIVYIRLNGITPPRYIGW